MKILMVGASGLVGSALVPALRQQGHQVVTLVRRPVRRDDEIAWNPAAGELAPAVLATTDAIVNLAGENIAADRWTAARKEALRRSRLDSTRTLVRATARAEPRPRVLVNASAIGFYGDRGDDVLTEDSPAGRGFLPELCAEWETEAQAAASLGVRVVRLRLGVVLAREGGALARLLPLFRLGLGGRLGDGRAWMSWIELDDLVRVVVAALTDPRLEGAINAVAPGPVTNRAFTAALGRVLHRPAILPVPRWLLQLVYGEMAGATLFASARVTPARLGATGFAFRQPDIVAALRYAIGSGGSAG
jgi:uncharacterized protein (TIGR01777 family)